MAPNAAGVHPLCNIFAVSSLPSFLEPPCANDTSRALHMVLFVWACMDTSKRNKAEIESRRVAIAEKLDEQASRRRASDFNDYQENNESKRFTAGIQISPGAHHSYSSIDMGSSSPRRSISPPDSPAPSSPAPAYLSGVTSMDSKPHIKDPDRPNRT